MLSPARATGGTIEENANVGAKYLMSSVVSEVQENISKRMEVDFRRCAPHSHARRCWNYLLKDQEALVSF